MAIEKYAASNVLYRNEPKDFGHAMELVMQQCDDELRVMNNQPHENWTQDRIDAQVRALTQQKLDALSALESWRTEIVSAATRVCERFPDTENFCHFADALKTGDYSELAI